MIAKPHEQNHVKIWIEWIIHIILFFLSVSGFRTNYWPVDELLLLFYSIIIYNDFFVFIQDVSQKNYLDLYMKNYTKKNIRRVLIINNVYSKHRCLKSTRWIRMKIFKKVSVTVITEISIHLLISNGTTNIFFYLMIPLKILGILHITCPKSKRFRGIQMFISIMTFDAFHKIIKFSYQDLNTLFELNSFLTIS